MRTVKHGGVRRRGKTIRDLAEATGKSERWVAAVTSEPREEYLARAQERGERIVEAYRSGKTMRAVAAEFGVSVSTVQRHVKRAQEPAS